MNKKIILIIMIVAVSVLFAGDVDKKAGKYGMKMLNIPSSIEQASTGGTSFLSNDALSFIGNPTVGLTNKIKALSFVNNMWLFDTKMYNIGISYQDGKSSYGFAFRYLDYGDFEHRDDTGLRLGDYHPTDVHMVLNYSRRIHPDVNVGVNTNVMYQKIQLSSAYGLAWDIGALYKTPIRGMKLSLNLKSLGFTTKMDKEKIDIPFSQEFAVIKDFELAHFTLGTEVKATHIADDEDIKLSLGVNSKLSNRFVVRCGYKFNYDIESFSAGIGVNLRRLVINYSYLSIDNDIDDVHMIGISYKL